MPPFKKCLCHSPASVPSWLSDTWKIFKFLKFLLLLYIVKSLDYSTLYCLKLPAAVSWFPSYLFPFSASKTPIILMVLIEPLTASSEMASQNLEINPNLETSFFFILFFFSFHFSPNFFPYILLKDSKSYILLNATVMSTSNIFPV